MHALFLWVGLATAADLDADGCDDAIAHACVHPTSTVAVGAVIGRGAHVGPGIDVGVAQIGARAMLVGHAFGGPLTVGDGAVVGRRAVVGADATFGDLDVAADVVIGPRLLAGDGGTIGYGARLGSDVELVGEAVIGNLATIGDRVVVSGSVGRATVVADDARVDGVVGADAFVASDAVVHEGARVGRGAVIGAGVVVQAGARVGRGAEIGAHAIVQGRVRAGVEVSSCKRVSVGVVADVGQALPTIPGCTASGVVRPLVACASDDATCAASCGAAGGTWLGATCDCSASPLGPIWNRTTCADPEAIAHPVSARCVAAGGDWQGAACGCDDFPSGHEWNGFTCYDDSGGYQTACEASGGVWQPWQYAVGYDERSCDCTDLGVGFGPDNDGACVDGSAGEAAICDATGGHWVLRQGWCSCQTAGPNYSWDEGVGCHPSPEEESCGSTGGVWHDLVCDCATAGPGAVWDGSTCGTPQEADACIASGGSWTESGCACGPSSEWDPSRWTCQASDPAACASSGGTFIGGACDCSAVGPIARYAGPGAGCQIDGEAQTCEAAGGVWYGPSSTCDCPGTELWSGQCTTVAEHQCVYDGHTWTGTTCECAHGFDWNGRSCVYSDEAYLCEYEDPIGGAWDDAADTCDCGHPGAGMWDSALWICDTERLPEAACESEGGSWAGGTCECPWYQSWTGQHCVYDPTLEGCDRTGGVWVGLLETCECPSGRPDEWDASARVCEFEENPNCAAAGGAWTGFTCDCPGYDRWNRDLGHCVYDFEKQECLDDYYTPAYWHVDRDECICPSGGWSYNGILGDCQF